MTEKDGDDLRISKRSVKGVMKDVTDRVSDDAAIRLTSQVERMVKKKTQAAKVIAESQDRVTVREEDVRKVEEIVDIMDSEG